MRKLHQIKFFNRFAAIFEYLPTCFIICLETNEMKQGKWWLTDKTTVELYRINRKFMQIYVLSPFLFQKRLKGILYKHSLSMASMIGGLTT